MAEQMSGIFQREVKHYHRIARYRRMIGYAGFTGYWSSAGRGRKRFVRSFADAMEMDYNGIG